MTILEAIKSVENRESLILFLDDPQAKKVLAAWTLRKPKCEDRVLKKGEDLEKAYSGLWDSLDMDYFGLSDIAGVPLRATEEIFRRAKVAHVVYPDGTISASATTFLRAEVTNLITPFIPRGVPVSRKSK